MVDLRPSMKVDAVEYQMRHGKKRDGISMVMCVFTAKMGRKMGDRSVLSIVGAVYSQLLHLAALLRRMKLR